MCCSFDTTAMDKQVCFVLLSCMFATVYLQDPSTRLVIDFVTDELQQRKEPLSLIDLLVYQPFEMMAKENFLVQVTAQNTSYQQFICTGIVNTQYYTNAFVMDDAHCSIDQPGSPRTMLINTDDFQKTINKAVDLINKEFPHMMIAAALKEVKILVTGCFNKVLFSTFELTVAKTSYFNIPWINAYDNTACNVLDDNWPYVRLKYSVRGVTGTLIDDPVIDQRFLEEVNSTK